MVEEAAAYFSGLYDRLDVRVVILRANGRAFSAGADLGSVAFAESGAGRPQRQMAMQKRYSGLIKLMRGCPQPIIGLVHGPACGGGFSLALACDVRYAAPNARMNAAYIRVGLGGCDMGAGYLLPRLVGLSNASEFLLTGRFILAERAQGDGPRQRNRRRGQVAGRRVGARRRYAEDRADGLANDQGDTQRGDRRAEPRSRVGARRSSTGDAAGDVGSPRGGRRVQGEARAALRGSIRTALFSSSLSRAHSPPRARRYIPAAGSDAFTAPMPCPALQISRQALLLEPPSEMSTPALSFFASASGSRPLASSDGARNDARAPVKPLVTMMSFAAAVDDHLLERRLRIRLDAGEKRRADIGEVRAERLGRQDRAPGGDAAGQQQRARPTIPGFPEPARTARASRYGRPRRRRPR